MPWVSNHYICWGWWHWSRNQRCLEQRVGRRVFLSLTLHLFWVTLPRAVEYVHLLGSGIQAVCRKVTLTKAGFSSSYESPGCGELYAGIPGCNCSHCVFVGLSSNHKLFSVVFWLSLQILVSWHVWKGLQSRSTYLLNILCSSYLTKFLWNWLMQLKCTLGLYWIRN